MLGVDKLRVALLVLSFLSVGALTLWQVFMQERFRFTLVRHLDINSSTSREPEETVEITIDYHDNASLDTKKNTSSSSLTQPQRAQCSPREKIMFLKTHKTGSSTITNILNRFGNKRKLTFALPKSGSLFNWPGRFKINQMVPLYASPHILCNHVRYNKKTIRHLFPKDQSSYITILRYPITHYESTFNYLELWKGLGIQGTNNMDILLKYLQSASTVKSAKLHLKHRSRLLRNPMMYDLGLDFRYYQDLNAVKSYIEFLDKEYDVVVIMEHFDESVVLMKRLLCWDFDDIVYVKHNERQAKEKKKTSKLLEMNIKSWNQADVLLYDYFNKTLWKKIAEQGPDFYKDLSLFRKRLKEVFDVCIGSRVVTEIYNGKYVQGHGLKKDIPAANKTFCTNLVKSELNYLNENMATLRQRQNARDSPGEFKNDFDKGNDWDKAKDLVHRPVFAVPGQTTGKPNMTTPKS